MPLGGALIAGIPSLVQLGAGIFQKHKANNLKKSNYVPPQLIMNRDLAMQQAYSRRAPGAAFAEEQSRRLTANQIAGAQRMFGGDANKIAAISSGAVAGAQDANKAIASQGQAFSENAFGKLSNANIALANNDRQNQSDYLQTKNALDNAGNTNIFGGISNLSTAALAGLASKGNVGAKATKTVSMFAGMCVKTIVFMSPILSASLVARTYENAVSTPAIEKINARSVSGTPNLVKNQNDTILCITNPPAKESMEKSAESFQIIFFDCGDRFPWSSEFGFVGVCNSIFISYLQ